MHELKINLEKHSLETEQETQEVKNKQLESIYSLMCAALADNNRYV